MYGPEDETGRENNNDNLVQEGNNNEGEEMEGGSHQEMESHPEQNYEQENEYQAEEKYQQEQQYQPDEKYQQDQPYQNDDNFQQEQPYQQDDNYQQDQQYQGNDNLLNQPGDENSFHLGKYIDKFQESPQFNEKEKQLSQKIDDFIRTKTGKTLSDYTKYIFLVNKILMITTFIEFLFQRFDIVTLFFCCVLIFIELEVFTYKHIYKWLLVLIGSLFLDAIVLIDISPVS
jgi:hypothetical protein